MHAALSSVPWNTPTLWQEANACLATTVGRNRSAMIDARRQAVQIRQHLEGAACLMDRLCQRTCPDCSDVCCQRAWVWADFKDLLFFHLADIPAPDRQLLGRHADQCRYGGPDGCRLDRTQRPFVCTWYLCPAQTRLLSGQPAEKQGLLSVLQQIKNRRRQMETAFIRAVIPTGRRRFRA